MGGSIAKTHNTTGMTQAQDEKERYGTGVSCMVIVNNKTPQHFHSVNEWGPEARKEMANTISKKIHLMRGETSTNLQNIIQMIMCIHYHDIQYSTYLCPFQDYCNELLALHIDWMSCLLLTVLLPSQSKIELIVVFT